MVKLSQIIEEKNRNGETCVSFEFFPPKTLDGAESLLQRVAEMGERLKPTFVSLTWRSTFKDELVWLKIGSMIQKQLGIEVLMHLTCNLPRKDLIRVLKNAREAGIQNILALRGDANHIASSNDTGASSSNENGSEKWHAVRDGFKNAVELVHLIRQEHGDYFSIGVAGYPEVHTSCWNSPHLPPSEQSRQLDLLRLKDKVDAGADFVITQFFYKVDVFWDFRRRCREVGINVPIIPGYAPIQYYSSFLKFKSWVRSDVPSEIGQHLLEIKDNDEEVQSYGIDVGTKQCGELIKGDVPGIHFFTLNLGTSVAAILKRLHLRDDSLIQGNRELPWRGLIRDREEVRPIFWAHRYSSYVSRTSTWQEFPNGRWGSSRNAANFELGGYYLAAAKKQDKTRDDLLKMWGTPQNEKEVGRVFVAYMQGLIEQLPWCDQQLAGETEMISEDLCWINRNGFLTINSQPRLNGVPSSDPTYGWGGPDGVCFQKAYIEFFCSPENWEKLRRYLDSDEFKGRLSYHAINNAGDEFIDSVIMVEEEKENEGVSASTTPVVTSPTNLKLRKDSFVNEIVEQEQEKRRKARINAVTWGVFPAREIIQPTVVDTDSFRVWKDEAFALWENQWMAIYKIPEQIDSKQAIESSSAVDLSSSSNVENVVLTEEEEASVKVLQTIRDTWYLVNIVDNNYVDETADIFDIFKRVILDDMSPTQLRDRVDILEKENTYLFKELIKLRSIAKRLLDQNKQQEQQLLSETSDKGNNTTMGNRKANQQKWHDEEVLSSPVLRALSSPPPTRRSYKNLGDLTL